MGASLAVEHVALIACADRRRFRRRFVGAHDDGDGSVCASNRCLPLGRSLRKCWVSFFGRQHDRKVFIDLLHIEDLRPRLMSLMERISIS